MDLERVIMYFAPLHRPLVRADVNIVVSLFESGDALEDVDEEYIRGVLDLFGRRWGSDSIPPAALKDAMLKELKRRFGREK